MKDEWHLCEWRVELWVDIKKNLRKKRVKSLRVMCPEGMWSGVGSMSTQAPAC